MKQFKLIILPINDSLDNAVIEYFNNKEEIINFFINTLNFTDNESEQIVNYAITNFNNQDINQFIYNKLKILSLDEKYIIKKVGD